MRTCVRTWLAKQDDREEDLTKPVVSISFGLPAIFLMGGASRNDGDPVAVVVREGDVVVMSGKSRLGVHGVPRVFDESDARSPTATAAAAAGGGGGDDSPGPRARAAAWHALRGRINVNVRQVYSDDFPIA